MRKTNVGSSCISFTSNTYHEIERVPCGWDGGASAYLHGWEGSGATALVVTCPVGEHASGGHRGGALDAVGPEVTDQRWAARSL